MIDALATALAPAGYRVLPYEKGIDRPELVTLLVELRSVVPAPHPAPPGTRNYTFDVAVVSPRRDLPKAGAELDVALAVVLAAIDDAPMLLWSRAERGQHRETQLPAYVVTVVATDQ